MKQQRDNYISQTIDLQNKINTIKAGKFNTYQDIFGKDKSDSNLPYSTTTSAYHENIEKTALYVGTDPGLRTHAQSTYGDSKKIAFILNQSNGDSALEEFVSPVDHKEIKQLTLKTFPITSRDIDYKTNSHKHRTQMETKKKLDENVLNTELALSRIPTFNNNDDGTTRQKHQERKKATSCLRQFYNSKWHQKQLRNSKAMKQRGINVIKRQQEGRIKKHYGRNDVKFSYFYGAAGRGTNSRIRGFLRRGHSALIDALALDSTMFITDEYRTTKLCCLCNQPVSHPNKQNGKKNLGTIVCVNPECIGKRYGCVARSRDANASMNRILSGLHQQILGSPHRAFNPSSSPVSNDIKKISQELKSSFHPPMVDMPLRQ